jgi:two-component system, NarL family, sensor histidine kinase UhpB
MQLDAQAERAAKQLGTFRRQESLTRLSVESPNVAPSWNYRAMLRLRRAFLVALSYYVGARIGFLLQGPQVPQSVLWLPNSILLAVCIVNPPRRWAMLLLGALPAQLLVGWENHAPLGTMSLIYLTNCADAMLGATVWRMISPNEPRIEGLKRMLGFLVLSAALPTIVVSFADAGLTVLTKWSDHYWLAFSTRARANVLTNVMFVPAAVALLTTRRAALRAQLTSRWHEATILLLGLIATSLIVFSRPVESIESATLAYVPLLFVVWAAVRFGVTMTGTLLLALAYLTAWMAFRHGIQPSHGPDEIVPAVQFELLAIAIPVMCLSAVVQDREGTSRALAASQHALNQSLVQIRNLAGRLLSATEEERTRIARELHDDVNQQLAALGIGLSALKRRLPNDDPLREEVAALQRQAMHAADSIRALSHELHPAALRHAGLVPAMRELCAQYTRGETMRAVLSVKRDLDVDVPDDVALCVYRVTQEALRNAARHSGAGTAQVTLRASEGALELKVEDEGKGFDEPVGRRRGGLGLTSMDERARIVGGSVHVDTAPGHGTRIFLRVPNRSTHGPSDASPGG